MSLVTGGVSMGLAAFNRMRRLQGEKETKEEQKTEIKIEEQKKAPPRKR